MLYLPTNMKYEVLLNCEGISHTDDPSIPKRCQDCIDGTAGSLQLTGTWLQAYIRLVREDEPTNELFDALNDANLIPPCLTTGAKRYATTAVWTHS